MKPAAPHAQDHADHEDAFLPYRDRIVFSLAMASAIVFLPFSVANFLQDRIPLSIAMLAIVLILTVDALAIHRGKRPPIPLWTLVFPVIASLALAIVTPLYIDLTWSYPAIILFYFILPQRTANWLAGLIVVSVTVLVFYTFRGTDFHMRVTTRLAGSLLLTALLSNIFINLLSGLQRELRRQTIIDPLTGAFNRRHMDAVLADAFARARRGAAPPSLLVIDIDHFKRINDEFGHGTGDQVLKRVVEVIQRHVRSSDALFRSGGEEFVLFLPETSQQGAAIVAEQIRASVSASPMLDHRPVTISVGVAALAAGHTLDDWLRHGDDALYCAKDAGRNRVCAAPEAVPVPSAG